MWKPILSLMLILSVQSLKTHHPTHQQESAVQSNLKVSNWIYGSLTETQVRDQTFKLVKESKNIVKCNLDFPFYNGVRCLRCHSE